MFFKRLKINDYLKRIIVLLSIPLIESQVIWNEYEYSSTFWYAVIKLVYCAFHHYFTWYKTCFRDTASELFGELFDDPFGNNIYDWTYVETSFIIEILLCSVEVYFCNTFLRYQMLWGWYFIARILFSDRSSNIYNPFHYNFYLHCLYYKFRFWDTIVRASIYSITS